MAGRDVAPVARIDELALRLPELDRNANLGFPTIMPALQCGHFMPSRGALWGRFVGENPRKCKGFL